jgi:hypothetical protein
MPWGPSPGFFCLMPRLGSLADMGMWIHRMESVSKETMTGVCRACGPVPLRKKGSWYACAVSQARFNGDSTAVNRLRKRLLREQGDCCAACGETDRKFVLDHCHATELVRGVLCDRCNTILGMCGDDLAVLEACMVYLKREPAGPKWPGKAPAKAR